MFTLSLDVFSHRDTTPLAFQTGLRLCLAGCMSDFLHPPPAEIELGMPASYPDVEVLAQRGSQNAKHLFNDVPLSKTLDASHSGTANQSLDHCHGSIMCTKECSFSRLPANTWVFKKVIEDGTS